MYKNLESYGGIKYSYQENRYAETIYKTFLKPSEIIGSQESIRDYKESHSYGSTDVGDVSWLVPTADVRTATWVPGTAAHSWQAVASGGTSIGLKGAKLAAQVIGATALDIFKNPDIVNEAKNELDIRVGKDFEYKALLGNRKPPLNYRKVN
jgi:aminobenzoyl-glutamate utilization protein B